MIDATLKGFILKKLSSLQCCRFLIAVSIAIVGTHSEFSYSAASSKLNVYVIAGQSNASNYGEIDELPLSLNLDVSSVSYSFRNGSESCNVRTCSEGFVSMDFWNKTRFGIELGLARHLADNRDTNFAIIKVFQPATNLHTDWNPDAIPTTNGYDADNPLLYQELVKEVKLRIAELRSLYPSKTVSLEGLVWVQGESDALDSRGVNEPFTSAAISYEQNLRNFLHRVRLDLRSENLKIYLTELSSLSNVLGSANIRVGQWRLSQPGQLLTLNHDRNVEMIHTSDLDFEDENGNGDPLDDLHYDSLSYFRLGDRVAERIILSENQSLFYVERAELVQFYNATQRAHWATADLPMNKLSAELYRYHKKLGRLYTYASATQNRVLLVDCLTDVLDPTTAGYHRKTVHIVRKHDCYYGSGEVKVRNIGWINSDDDLVYEPDNRQPLYRCWANGLKSYLLGHRADCGTPLHINRYLLGYIERNI